MRLCAAVLVVAAVISTPFGRAVGAVEAEDPEPIYILSAKAYRLPAGTYIAAIKLGDGSTIELALLEYTAPRTTEYFNDLISKRFYDNTAWNRVVPGFVVQGGAPIGVDRGIDVAVPEPESNDESCTRGAIFLARKVVPEGTEGYKYADTVGDQFCILLEDAPYLNDDFTVFGRVISGMELLDGVDEGEPIVSVRLVRVPAGGR
jgi:cyclophilin family peptidyl-prolyl cis-trans isomerase